MTLSNDESIEVPLEARIRAARDGSPVALGELMEQARQYLMLVANREIRLDLRAKGGASDIVQETFLDAQRDFGQFKGASEAELRAWLRRLLLNNLSNFTRRFRATTKRAVGREVPLDAEKPDSEMRGLGSTIPAKTKTPSQQLMAGEAEVALLHAVERLPEHYREVILLRHRDGLSYADIADRTGRTAEAVRKLWTRAIERLNQELSSLHVGE